MTVEWFGKVLMYIGGGLGLVLIILLIIYFARRA